MFEHPASELQGPGAKVNSWPDENRSYGPVHLLFEEWPRRISDRSMPSCSIGVEPWPNHRATKLLICELAGVDDELAIELECTYGDFATYSAYPEVVEVVTALAADHVKIAIVSDFHVDLRPHLASLGLLDLISGFALSCEIGVAKPHPMMFQAALEMVGVAPERCLMVGDNPTPDTGASALGIATLILPLQRAPRPPLLQRVLSLVGVGSAAH